MRERLKKLPGEFKKNNSGGSFFFARPDQNEHIHLTIYSLRAAFFVKKILAGKCFFEPKSSSLPNLSERRAGTQRAPNIHETAALNPFFCFCRSIKTN